MNKEKILKYTIKGEATLKQAMELIEENQHRSLIVVDDKECVIGTLSDGDIRKAVLRDGLTITKVHSIMNLDFQYIKKGEEGKSEEIFLKTHVFLIPVIDRKGKLVDILESY